MFSILGPFLGLSVVPFGWPVSAESGSWECPFEINLNKVGVDFGHVVVASEGKPVSTLGWRRRRWLRRRGLVVVCASLGPPPLGRPSLVIGCENAQVEDVGVCGGDDVEMVVDEVLKAAGLVTSWPYVKPGEVYACEPKTPC